MTRDTKEQKTVRVVNADGASPVVLVCEHASAFIPSTFDNLGLSREARISHAAWDPGAFAVAESMSQRLDALLFASCVSRLVYDCNRPPHAQDAIPAKSEIYAIPGNTGLKPDERATRVARYYAPFQAGLAACMKRRPSPILVTIHSFTPVFHGVKRDVEIGILHDTDTRLADAYLETAGNHTTLRVERNEPYGPGDGVTHTLREHGVAHGHLNVMIELRNDLIADPDAQIAMGDMLAGWTQDALNALTAEVIPWKA